MVSVYVKNLLLQFIWEEWEPIAELEKISGGGDGTNCGLDHFEVNKSTTRFVYA